jgi:DNA-binding response OmpR family regulator
MKILVVDDDLVLSDLVAFSLRRDGYSVLQAADGVTALKLWREHNPDLCIFDVNLPKSVPHWDGFRLCQTIRQESNVPILLLTVRGDENDIVQGLEFGADDYVVKPFSPRQLLARVQSLLRRARQYLPVITQNLSNFDPVRREVISQSGQRVQLTILEARLFEILLRNIGFVLTNEYILDRVWGTSGGSREMLRQLVHRLRVKIENEPFLLETIAGMGYCLKKQDE